MGYVTAVEPPVDADKWAVATGMNSSLDIPQAGGSGLLAFPYATWLTSILLTLSLLNSPMNLMYPGYGSMLGMYPGAMMGGMGGIYGACGHSVSQVIRTG